MDPDEPRFARFSPRGKVHILRDRLHLVSDTLGEPPTGEAGEWLMGRQWALCGQLGPTGTTHDVNTFPDRDLCFRCVKAWPYDEVKLFEHPQGFKPQR